MPNDNLKFVDPRTFTESDLPIIVLSDDRRGFIGWAIRQHTSGNYNHVFIMHKPGMCVSQDFSGFKEKSINKYLVPSQMLKFWRIKDLTVFDKDRINTAIANRLALPWWWRTYDFLGVIGGQFLRIKWLQNPWQTFCSEQVNIDYLWSTKAGASMGIKQPSPSELDKIFKEFPNIMEVLGYWWKD